MKYKPTVKEDICKYCGIEIRIEGEDANKKNTDVCQKCKRGKK